MNETRKQKAQARRDMLDMQHDEMIERRGWAEFRDAGLLWWINTMLHLFGWAIAVEMCDDGKTIRCAYPVRCKFRGFSSECNDRGFMRLSNHIKDNAGRLAKDTNKEAKE